MKEALLCHKLFTEKGLTLAAAESITGGNLSHEITLISGASQYFLGSIIAYSNFAKSKILSIPEALITEKGAVSQEIALLMATGVRDLMGSDVGVSLTGFAESPAAYFACIAYGPEIHSWTKKAEGTREMVIKSATHDMLLTLSKVIGKQNGL